MNIAKRNQLRGTIYRSLAGCFQPPGSDIGVRVEVMSDAICELYPELVKYLPDVSEGADAIRQDFERLSAACGTQPEETAPPGVREMRVMISADDILRLREKADLSSEELSVSCHLALLFKLAGCLVQKMPAADTDATDAASDDDAILREVLMICLAPPVTDFFGWIEKSARTAFYRDLVRLTRAFLHEEAAAGK